MVLTSINLNIAVAFSPFSFCELSTCELHASVMSYSMFSNACSISTSRQIYAAKNPSLTADGDKLAGYLDAGLTSRLEW
jgi:hypothetical protein